MRTLLYSFDVKYIKGILNQIANCLSHLEPINDRIRLPRMHVSEIISQLQITAGKLELLRKANIQDDELALPKHVI